MNPKKRCVEKRAALALIRVAALVLLFFQLSWVRGAEPVQAGKALVISQSEPASKTGLSIIREGGNAVDAAVATAFALAVTHPSAGNIGGGGFLVFFSPKTGADAYDFREKAPAASSPTMFLISNRYSFERHHDTSISVGVPGTVAGLHLAWKEHGTAPWPRLLAPAIALAETGFEVGPGLAASLKAALPELGKDRAALAQFSKAGKPYEPGDILKQPDLAKTLKRIAKHGPSEFYTGETARLLAAVIASRGGLITMADLAAYQAKRREPIHGNYRGYDILSMPPPSSGGVAIIETLNILEGFDLKGLGPGSAGSIHLMTEAMRRSFADRARYLGDPDFNPGMPVDLLVSKEHGAKLRATISPAKASESSPGNFEWAHESPETTHVSIVDPDGNGVALTYTLEQGYGSKIVVPGAGFLLNNEMGDFNAAPGMTTTNGLIGTAPNLAGPGKRMLSSMSPTIVLKAGKLFMVTGSPGGRTIINTVLETIVNTVDFQMNAQDAVNAPRFHHQWLPDILYVERNGFSSDSIKILRQLGHTIQTSPMQGMAEVIIRRGSGWEGGVDHRAPDGGAAAW